MTNVDETHERTLAELMGRCTYCGATAVAEMAGPNVAVRVCGDHIDKITELCAKPEPVRRRRWWQR